MTLLTMLLVLAAVRLLVPAHPRSRWSRGQPGLASPALTVAAAPGWPVGVLPVAAVLAAALVLGPLLGGMRGFVLAVAAALLASTATRLALLRRRRRAALRTSRLVVEGCAVLAANLRIGMVPTQALAGAAGGCPLLRPAHETLLMGGDVATVWLRQASDPGAGGLRELARAWQVAHRTGASLTSTLDQVAAGQSADLSLQAVVNSELAASRATGKLMAALPLLGVGMGYLLGGDPVSWLLAGLAGWICLLVGVALACAGVWWIESLARRVSIPG